MEGVGGRILPTSLAVAVFVAATGWRPWSRATTPLQVLEREEAEWSAALCFNAPAELPLQRRQYVPSKPQRRSLTNSSPWPTSRTNESPRAPQCSHEALSASARLLAVLEGNRSFMEGPGGARTGRDVPHIVRPRWVGRELALGPIVHALVPLLWAVSLEANPSSAMAAFAPRARALSGKDATSSSEAAMPTLLSPELRVFAASSTCTAEAHSLACFLRPAGRHLQHRHLLGSVSEERPASLTDVALKRDTDVVERYECGAQLSKATLRWPWATDPAPDALPTPPDARTLEATETEPLRPSPGMPNSLLPSLHGAAAIPAG